MFLFEYFDNEMYSLYRMNKLTFYFTAPLSFALCNQTVAGNIHHFKRCKSAINNLSGCVHRSFLVVCVAILSTSFFTDVSIFLAPSQEYDVSISNPVFKALIGLVVVHLGCTLR